MPSRFGSLIVKPLQEIGKQEKRVQPKVIFTDGLDKCADGDAHAEIIKINAPSIREGSTPFRWAISSRTEPYIIPISKQNSIAPVTYSVELPISCQADSEIEMYLLGGRTYLKNKISRNSCHHGQLTTISGPLSRQWLACLLTLLLPCIMCPVHETCNSVIKCNLF